MIDFTPIQEFGEQFLLQELTFRQSVEIADIDKELDERRLTKLLSFILKSRQDPLELTVQQRYYFLLQYLYKQENTILDTTTRKQIPLYFKNTACSTWNIGLEHGTQIVKQMTGKEAEYWELACATVPKKLAGMIAIQYVDTSIPELAEYPDPNCDQEVWKDLIQKRCAYLVDLPSSEFERIYTRFHELNCKLNSHLHIGLSKDGFCLYGGTDDAPMRFCAIDGVTRTIAELEE